MFSPNDKSLLESKGITEAMVMSQLERFKTGFPYLKLDSAASVGNGIIRLSRENEDRAIAAWQEYLAEGGKVTKFVPASGAASRMFKALYAFVNGTDETPAPGSDVAQILDNIDALPFIFELNSALQDMYGKTARQLLSEGRYRDVVAAIVNGGKGMNYGNLPKALLTFHRYTDGSVRTPLEEQLTEGAESASSNGHTALHFTVSANHVPLFLKKIEEVKPAVEQRTGVKFDITYSEQKPSTDTIAAEADSDAPFRDDDGNLVFRPGGHGALIENLSEIKTPVVFIKNIDNVVPDSKRSISNRYKQVIAGVLIETVGKIKEYYDALTSGVYTINMLEMAREFAINTLNIKGEWSEKLSGRELADFLIKKFDRPVRVCGMVRNEGEPGGGPFMAYNADATISPQILESTQIDMSITENVAMMKNATHFNPVDLVCWIDSPQGHHFNLPDFVDPDTGFISSKSLGGRELRALELPGLWNGAMSDWNTVFVEVPAETFNPVKTVNDLLRPIHQA